MRLVSFFQLIASIGAAGRADHGRCGPAIPPAHLVAQDAAHHRTKDGTTADASATLAAGLGIGYGGFTYTKETVSVPLLLSAGAIAFGVFLLVIGRK